MTVYADSWATSLPSDILDHTVNMQGGLMPNRPVLQEGVLAPPSVLAEPALSANGPSNVSQPPPLVPSHVSPPPGAWAPFNAERQRELDTVRLDNLASRAGWTTFSEFRAQRASTQSAEAGRSSTRTPSAVGSSQIAQLRSAVTAIQGQLDVVMNGVDSVQQQMENMRHDNHCCICLTGTQDSQLLPCMHNKFCKACIEQHLARSNHCPICRAAVRGMLTSFG